MFYPVESLRRGGRFYLCWVADSWPLRFATITHRQLWSQDIRQICDDLLEVMKNESGRTRNRFSLRLSSQLMRGLVRLYQRKVTVFVGDLCMINALVMKSTHTKKMHDTTTRPQLPRLVIEEQVDDKIEERIQNSNNVVAHVEDITIKEPTLPENRTLLDDGFGELNPNQPFQMLVDQSVEMMLVQETSAVHHSGIDLPEISTDKSHDKSRLVPLESAQMERISEHDISIFRKSVGGELIPGTDFEKDIPEIPEIPPPVLSTPHAENRVGQILLSDGTTLAKPNENVKDKSLEEFVLQELEEEPQVKRRKLRCKLIVDKNTELSSKFIRSRIANVNVELRCEDSINDVINICPTPNILLNRAAHCGPTLRSNLGYQLSHMFSRNLGIVQRHTGDDDIEEMVAQRSRQSHTRSILEKIDEEIEPVDKRIASMHHQVQDISKEINITELNIQDELQGQVPQGQMDISDLPTQRILSTSEVEQYAGDRGPPQKRQRRSGYVSYRLSQLSALEIPNIETNKENIPDYENRQQDAERLTTMLVEAGLADIDVQDRQTDVELTQVTIRQKNRKTVSETSETPLGSLDRTKVSLGDSDRTTDSKRFIREEWGTQGTMHKIYKCIKRGVKPLDLRYLITRGPIISGHQRVIAARCFTSVLKLKQHGFISIVKDSTSYEIVDISLGSKITASKK